MSKVSKLQYRHLSIAVIIALAFGAYFLRHYFALVVLASILALLFNPVFQRLKRRTKRPAAAASLTFVISLFSIILPVSLIIFITYLQARNIVNNYTGPNSINFGKLGQQILDSINSFLAQFPNTHPITPESIANTFNQILSNSVQAVLQFITSSVGSIISFITSFIIFVYVFLSLLIYQDTIIDTIKQLNPLGDEASNLFLQKMGDMTKAMVRGQFIIATLQGLAGALSFYVIGAHNIFIFLWLIFSVLCLIPLGSGIIIIPAGIIMILFGDVWQGAVVLGTHFFITTNIDNILRPRLVPKTAKLNPALTILAVFAGVGMFGFLGIIIGPVVMILITATVDMYLSAKRSQNA